MYSKTKGWGGRRGAASSGQAYRAAEKEKGRVYHGHTHNHTHLSDVAHLFQDRLHAVGCVARGRVMSNGARRQVQLHQARGATHSVEPDSEVAVDRGSALRRLTHAVRWGGPGVGGTVRANQEPWASHTLGRARKAHTSMIAPRTTLCILAHATSQCTASEKQHPILSNNPPHPQLPHPSHSPTRYLGTPCASARLMYVWEKEAGTYQEGTRHQRWRPKRCCTKFRSRWACPPQTCSRGR